MQIHRRLLVARLDPERLFAPRLDKISQEDADSVRLIALNYPNNPTSALADKAFFERVVAFAKKHNVIICHDAAYTEITRRLKQQLLELKQDLGDTDEKYPELLKVRQAAW